MMRNDLQFERSRSSRYLLIAAVALAIGITLLLLLSQTTSVGAAVYLVILPIVFIGVADTVSQLSRRAYMRAGLAPDEPVRRVPFQRPPPSLRG